MYSFTAEPAVPSQCGLGEGPVWHQNQLWFVDIEGRTLQCYDPARGEHQRFQAGQRIGFAVPTTQPGRWIVGLEDGLAEWRPASQPLPDLFHRPASMPQGARFNDAKTSPAGQLYAGTMGIKTTPNLGTLYRLDPDGQCHDLIDQLTISNGLAWRVPDQRMYFIDTPTRQIDAFDWDPDTGEISRRRCAYRFADDAGNPDGMCIDAAGHLWVAMWGGARVLGIDPVAGQVVGQVDVPANCVTSCCFGGPDLTKLFITTSNAWISDADRQAQPNAGDVFVAPMQTPGLPTTLLDYRSQ